MSTRLIGLIASLCCAGACDTASPNAAMDLAAAGDLSAPTDAMITGDKSCLYVAVCAGSCAVGDRACLQGCVNRGTAQAQTLYQALAACAVQQCLPNGGAMVDGGAGSCTSANDSSSGCQACAAAQGQGQACASQLTACSQN